MNAASTAPASTFYTLVAVTQLLCTIVMSIADGGDFHSRGARYSLATRPTCIPPFVFLTLHHKFLYPVLCHGVPFIMYAAACNPGSMYFRLTAAIFMSMYSLAETSVTSSHRDYANLYTSWALVLSSSTNVAAGVALGVSVLLVSGSGLSKLLVGGTSEWAHSSTLSTVLAAYNEYSLDRCGPLIPALNVELRRKDWAVTLLSVTTLMFECILVPLSMFMPSHVRWIMMLLSVGMHIGIGVIQSFIIGIAFLPNVATYNFGFGADSVHVGQESWWWGISVVAVFASVTLVRTMRSSSVRLLPEDWPCTPFALFAWNGKQWNKLFSTFVKGDKRLVLYNSTNVRSLVGKDIVPRCWSRVEQTNLRCEGMVHNGWEVLLGETFCHDVVLEQLLEHLLSEEDDVGRRRMKRKLSWDATKFVTNVSKWMVRTKRFVLIKNGTAMNRVAYVELDDERRIKSVIAEC